MFFGLGDWHDRNYRITSTIHEISFLSWSWLELIVFVRLNLSKVSMFSSAIQLNKHVVINQIFPWKRNVKLSSFLVHTEILFCMEIHAISDFCSFLKMLFDIQNNSLILIVWYKLHFKLQLLFLFISFMQKINCLYISGKITILIKYWSVLK